MFGGVLVKGEEGGMYDIVVLLKVTSQDRIKVGTFVAMFRDPGRFHTRKPKHEGDCTKNTPNNPPATTAMPALLCNAFFPNGALGYNIMERMVDVQRAGVKFLRRITQYRDAEPLIV